MIHTSLAPRTSSRLAMRLSAAILVLAACTKPGPTLQSDSQRSEAVQAAAPRPTPPPPFTSIDQASATEVLRYASTLEFTDDRAFADTTTVSEGNRRAFLRFSPEVGSRTVSTEALKQGRIAARWLRFGDSVRYPLPSASGYIWIDSIPSGWRLSYVASDSLRGRTVGYAIVIDDSLQKDNYPQPKSTFMGSIMAGCYYTDQRWVCPRFALMSQDSAVTWYGMRPQNQ
ncbi:MAG: hypothetical protein ABIZ91_10160 [Gemmatimonadaceae bacterium]